MLFVTLVFVEGKQFTRFLPQPDTSLHCSIAASTNVFMFRFFLANADHFANFDGTLPGVTPSPFKPACVFDNIVPP